MVLHFAPGTWPEHSEDLQSIIFGQAALQFYKDAPVITTSGLDAEKINDLVLKHPLNVTKTKLSPTQCQQLWEELLPQNTHTVLAVDVKLQLLRQVKLYVEKGLQTIGEGNLVEVPRESNKETEKDITSAADGDTKVRSEGNSIAAETDEISNNKGSVDGQPDHQTKSGEIANSDDKRIGIQADSAGDVVDERTARRKSRTRRSRIPSPDPEDLTASTTMVNKADEGKDLEPTNTSTEGDTKTVQVNNNEKSDVQQPYVKRKFSEDENLVESTLLTLSENPKFALFQEPVEHPGIKQPINMPSILQAVRQQSIKAADEVEVEINHMVANAVLCNRLNSEEALALLDTVQSTLQPLWEVEESTKEPPRKRRR